MHSALDGIPGVGPKRRNELLYRFKTMERVRNASAEELCKVPSITRQVAENIVEYFGGSDLAPVSAQLPGPDADG